MNECEVSQVLMSIQDHLFDAQVMAEEVEASEAIEYWCEDVQEAVSMLLNRAQKLGISGLREVE